MASKFGVGTFITDETELTTDILDLFYKPPVDRGLISGFPIDYPPVNSINDEGPFEFYVPKDPEHYTMMPMTRLSGVVEVLNNAGSTALTETTLTSCVNLFTQSLFKQVELEVMGTQVCDLSTPSYAYKAYIESHLGYSNQAKESHLAMALYEKDTPGKENNFLVAGANNTAATCTNDGLLKRAKVLRKKFNFSQTVHVDFLQCAKLLLPNVDLKFKFIRNPDTFSLLETTLGGKIKIHKLKLTVHKVVVNPQIRVMHEQALASGRFAHYPIQQSKIKSFLINSGSTSTNITQIFNGTLPRHLMIGFVDTKGFNSTINGNPFKFGNFGISYFDLTLNGKSVRTPFQVDFEGGQTAELYRWFLDNTGTKNENTTNGITHEDFVNNSCFFAYDFSPDLSNGFYLNHTNHGHLDLSLSFKTAPTSNVYMIVYAIFNQFVEIDSERNVKISDVE